MERGRHDAIRPGGDHEHHHRAHGSAAASRRGRRRTGLVHRHRAPRRRAPRRSLRDSGCRDEPQPGARARRGAGERHPRGARLCRSWRAAGAGGRARRRHRRARDHDAERHALPDRARRPGERPRRDLRQAVSHESRGRARPGPTGQGKRPRVLPDPQLHRLSDGAPRPRHGAARRARADPPAACGVHPGQSRRADRGRPRPGRKLALLGRAVRRVPGARRHRHPRPSSRELHHRARADRGRGRARQRRCPDGRCTTMGTSCCASRVARAARCG